MRLDEVFNLNEARGSGSFDYRYWFWAKKGASSYGFGYARQDIKVDIQVAGRAAADAAENILDVFDALEDDDKENLEVVDRKIKANTKRLKGIVDLFHSPIVIYWLNGEPTKAVELPSYEPNDVVDSRGRRIDVVDLFSDANTSEFVTKVMDWDKVTINDKDSLNTVTAKFIRRIFGKESSAKKIRALARGEGIEKAMSDLHFQVDGIEVRSFEESDYDLLPQDAIGSKKIVSKIATLITEKFPELLERARKRLG